MVVEILVLFGDERFEYKSHPFGCWAPPLQSVRQTDRPSLELS
jgi:hypothetical protein